jgi:hypothetical protein
MGHLDDFRERLRRLDDLAKRLPLWLEYVSLAVIVVVVGAASGHSFETTTSNAAFVVILFGVFNTIKWLSHHRQLRLTANTPVVEDRERPSTRESARSPRP